jgi:hypothetical protein
MAKADIARSKGPVQAGPSALERHIAFKKDQLGSGRVNAFGGLE